MKTYESLSLKFEIMEPTKKINLFLLDQTLLPHKEVWLNMIGLDQMIEAIQSLRVRGAPLIGVAASLFLAKMATDEFNIPVLSKAADLLYEARPTAVNLMNCISRMKNSLNENKSLDHFVQTALDLYLEDVQLCDQIAENGAKLIQDGDQILTHCNTGGLATAGVGTALGVIRKAFEQGKKIHVYIDETRPLLQGGRLTAWELQKLGIPCTLITDNMAAHLMSLKKITKAIVGSDRIAQNGDFANKIGTYNVAVICHYHKIPFYVAAPFTTVDPKCESGLQIPIEQRKPEEVLGVQGSFGQIQWAPHGIQVYNPSFDVTPSELTTGWIMDSGNYNHKDISKGIFKGVIS